MALRVLRCPNGLRHVSLDASHGEKIIFSEFSGSSVQIEGKQNTISIVAPSLSNISSAKKGVG